MNLSNLISNPIKSNNLQYMYKYCKKTIQNANNPDELLPIIKILIPLDNLKNKLVEIIDDLYQNIPPNLNPNKQSKITTKTIKNAINKPKKNMNNLWCIPASSQLKKLYLNSSSITEIFPDEILVSIIRYLPSSNYSKLPILSSNFHSIMIKYPSIYNKYKVVIDEFSMHYSAQCIKILINHKKKSVYIKLAELDVDSVGLETSRSINSLMFTASFDSKWGGLLPNNSFIGGIGGYKKRNGLKVLLNPFSVSFPWYSIPKWILYGDKWTRNGYSNIDNTLLHKNNNNNNSNKITNKTARDIWIDASSSITTFELENPQKSFITQLPQIFNKLNHLKFNGLLIDSPSKYITPKRFPLLMYLEFHKLQIDSQSKSVIQFMKKEKLRYENIDDLDLPINNDNEFIGIRSRINFKYKIISEILNLFKNYVNSNLKVFKYYDDGSTLNSTEFELARNVSTNNNDINNINALSISASIQSTTGHVEYISKLRQYNSIISFPETLEFISLINCDCRIDLSSTRNLIGLHLYNIHYTQLIWPINSIIQCLVCSTQSEMTEDWNDIFETNKYRIGIGSAKKYSKKNKNPNLPTMPTLYSIQSIITPVSSVGSILDYKLPVRFMKRITNRTLSPVTNNMNNNMSNINHMNTINLTPFQNIVHDNNMNPFDVDGLTLERSKTVTNTITSKSNNKAVSFAVSPMNRIKSAGSNTSDLSLSYIQEEKKDDIIYVENKLNKTKSLNVWNNNIPQDISDLDGGLDNDLNRSLSTNSNYDINKLTKLSSIGSNLDDDNNALAYNKNKLRLNIHPLMPTAEPLSKIPQKSIGFDPFEEYKKMELIIPKKDIDKELICMEIEDDFEIFYRLMNTIYANNHDLLNNKISIYEEWWDLKVALWIKTIGKQILPKSQRNII